MQSPIRPEEHIQDRRDLADDRRKASRLSLTVPIRYQIKDSRKDWQTVEALDVSLSGIRILVNHPISLDSLMDLDMKLPGIAESLQLIGLVKRIRPVFDQPVVECGIAFHNFKQMPRKEVFVDFMANKFCYLNVDRRINCVARPAASIEELKSAYQLIHREYIKRGYCKPQASGMYYSYFSLLPDSRTFILEKESQIHGTLSLITDSPCGLPMESLFPDEIAKLRAQGRRLAENSLLALDQELLGHGLFSLTHSEKHLYFFSIVKMMMDCARDLGVTDLLIAVHPKHEDLYRFLTFEPIGPVRDYPGALGNPALPMRWQIDDPVKFMPKESGVRKYFSQAPAKPALRFSHVEHTRKSIYELLTPLWPKMPKAAQAYFASLYSL